MTPLTKEGLQYTNGLIYYNTGSEMRVVYPYRGSDRPLTKEELDDLLNRMGLTAGILDKFGMNAYDTVTYESKIGIRKDSHVIFFINPAWIDISYSNTISSYKKLLDKFKDIFRDLEKGQGLIVRPSSEGIGYLYSKTDGGSELFIPKGDEGDKYIRCYIHIDCNNCYYDLANIFFVRFSSAYPEIGNDPDLSKKYYIPSDALVELTFEDHQVAYIDLTSGVDVMNGVKVNRVERDGLLTECSIKSQRLIRKIEIYYEMNASLYRK